MRMENGDGAVGRGAAGRYAGNKYTLLDPEKTSTAWFFGQDSRSRLRGKPSIVVGRCLAQGGGWLLVEMCIVDASILFFCDEFSLIL